MNSTVAKTLASCSLMVGLLLVTGLIGVFVSLSVDAIKSPQVPTINGVVLSNPWPIGKFELQDHHGQGFTEQDFLGKWHIVAHGYLSCPDVCPLTLTVLSQLVTLLEKNALTDEVKLVFYTVDPNRDTSEHLANYLEFFSPQIIGLTRGPDSSFVAFQQDLSIAVKYLVGEQQGFYEISHGVSLAIVNPQGALQAMLQPQIGPFGQPSLSSKILFDDILKVRSHYNRSDSSWRHSERLSEPYRDPAATKVLSLAGKMTD